MPNKFAQCVGFIRILHKNVLLEYAIYGLKILLNFPGKETRLYPL